LSVKSNFQTIPGTFDILPDGAASEGSHPFGSASWAFVENTIREIMARFNFREIRTPVLEQTELIARGIGALTDIVSKEMFAFERGDDHYVLRPEITAPVVRSYLQHRLDQRGGAQKLFYIGPCFRAERPQKGRYRQFHQFGCEVMGTPDARADAEIIVVMMTVFAAFGIRNMRLRINTLGDAESRPRYKDALVEYLRPHAGSLSETSRQRLETNPLRILDTKDAKERAIIEKAPRLIDYVDEESLAQYEEVKGYLSGLGIAFEEDPFLVRGLDYYTRTAFELESPDLGAQSALAGGGRYDLLAAEIGSSEAVPAVGFAAGIERLFLALEAAGVELPAEATPDVFLVALGDEALKWTFNMAYQLRIAGLYVSIDLKGRSMKAQMREANRQSARFAVIIGDDEIAGGTAKVRDMRGGEQAEVSFSDLSDYLLARSERMGATPVA
jgi:histidyl-tRNA synthetase